MSMRKRTKKSRQRGSHTHGWGSKKKHRGSGNRGGAGMAGTGKRSHSKKPRIWATRYFGKFERVSLQKKAQAINVGDLDSFVRKNNIAPSGDKLVIDLGKYGVSRLIGKGDVVKAYDITVNHSSPQAQEKIVKVGGQVTQNKASS
ncbi:MAG TPA: uL15m family ribosomal protein [Candidatus Nanoarchaeia archaeon]|nr:uL15m family ribosomal protein [Candidatus Nanoarchaeia archaeon]